MAETKETAKEFLSRLSEKNLPDSEVDAIVAEALAAGLKPVDVMRVQIAAAKKKENKVINYQTTTSEVASTKSEEVTKKSPAADKKLPKEANKDNPHNNQNNKLNQIWNVHKGVNVM